MARTPNTAAQPVEDIEVLPAVAQSIITGQDERAVAELQQDKMVRAVAQRMGYQLPADSTSADLIQRDIVVNMRRSVEACLEVGKGLAVLKEACGHGGFGERLEEIGIEIHVASRFITAARKFFKFADVGKFDQSSIGTQSKLLEMLVLDDEQIEELALTGQTGELALDDVSTMSVKELRAALRKEKKEKKLLEKVNKELQQEAQRVKYEDPDQRVQAIVVEATSHMRTALGLIDGRLRSALLGLTEDGMGDNSALAAGLLGQLQKSLRILRDELNLPDVVGDGKPEWQQWADQQDAQVTAEKMRINPQRLKVAHVINPEKRAEAGSAAGNQTPGRRRRSRQKKSRYMPLLVRSMAGSKASLMRGLSGLGVATQRKRRSDAGVSGLTLEHAQTISGSLMEGYRANDKRGATIIGVLEKLRANIPMLACVVDAETGEITELSPSAVSRALRQYKLHPDQLRTAAPAQELRSDHPNEVWQIDASISILFYVPEDGDLAPMHQAEFNKNKPGNFEKIKRQRLTRYVITDHFSGSIFVHYLAGGESTINMAEAFLRCIEQRTGQQHYGVPFYLMMDPGSAGTAGAFGNLLRRLQVQAIVNKVGNARAKGQVENAHNLVEINFESGFKLTRVPSIDWINEQAARWMRYYNSVRVHGRHGATRWAKWMEIAAHQLRVVDATLARELLTHTPATPKIDQFLRVRFAGRVWDVSGIAGVMVGETLQVTYNPFNPTAAFVVERDAHGHEQLIEVPEVVSEKGTGKGGFSEGSAHIAHEYKRPADTIADTNRKAIERLVTGTQTDEQAEAARKAKALPFGGRIDPYKHLDNVPDVTALPRRSTELEPAVTTASTVPERVLTVFEAATELRAQHGVDMSREKYQQITAWHPNGVPESQLESLAQRLSVRAGLRVVGGNQ